MPTWRGGGVDGWIVFGGPARASAGGGGGGRAARSGGAPVRGGALDRLPLGEGGPRGRPARRRADGRRPEAANHGRGRGRAPRPARGGEPPHPGRVPRSTGGADRRAGAPADRGAVAAAPRLDVEEADAARGRAGSGGRRRRAR